MEQTKKKKYKPNELKKEMKAQKTKKLPLVTLHVCHVTNLVTWHTCNVTNLVTWHSTTINSI
jgi:hypothetical protein